MKVAVDEKEAKDALISLDWFRKKFVIFQRCKKKMKMKLTENF
jgi:hypothetical protein